jgi:hypothetical protein
MATKAQRIKAGKANARSIAQQTREIQKNAKALIHNVIPKDIERALTAIGVVVGNKSLEYTPIEFSTLINSQYRINEATQTKYTVRVGYTQEYAAPLHERTNWKPRPPELKDGPAWNPNAKHHFLTDAAEEEKVTIRRIILGDLQL